MGDKADLPKRPASSYSLLRGVVLGGIVLAVVGGWYAWKRMNVSVEELVQEAPRPRPAPPTSRNVPRGASNAELDRVRHELSDQLEALLADRTRSQWSVIPAPIRDVRIDAAGKAWFGVPVAEGAVHHRQQSIREALAGKTRVLYSNPPLLADRRGRIWTREFRALRSYEGDSHQDYPLEPVTVAGAPSSQPARAGRSGNAAQRVSVQEIALEDAAGNCWFIGGGLPGAWQVIRIGPDGKQDRFPIAGEIPANAFADALDFSLIEQPQGVITLAAPIGPLRPQGDSAADGKMLVFRSSETGMTQLHPEACSHDVKTVLPQRDGSIKYLCYGGRLWTWWPPERLETAREIARGYINDLDSPEASRRDRAMRGLLTIGPQLVPLLPAADDPSLSPEARQRLEVVRANYLAAAQVDDRGIHSEVAAYDVGIAFGTASPVARTHDGGVVLYAANVQREEPRQTDPKALVWIDPEGRCTVRSLTETWSEVDVESSSRSSFADAEGRLYTAGYVFRSGRIYLDSSIILPDASVVKAIPPGMAIHRIIGQDSDGRIYAESTGRLLVLDATLPATPDWRWASYWGHEFTSLPGQAHGWLHLPYQDQPPRIRVLGHGPVYELPEAPELALSIRLIPLKDRTVVCEPAEGAAGSAMFFDGEVWHRADTLQQLVRENIAMIQSLAPQSFEPTEYGSSIAANDQGGLWLAIRPPRVPRGVVAAAGEEQTILYYDGRAWRDVLADIRKIDPTYSGDAIGTGDQGRAILLNDPEHRRTLWVTYEAGSVGVKVCGVDQVLRGARTLRYVSDPGGGVWLWTTAGGGSSRLIHGDTGSAARPRTMPLLTDSRGRVWFADLGRGMLLCKVGQTWLELPVKHLQATSRMIQGPDQRLWLLQTEWVSSIELADGPGAQIREAARWQWDGPKESFEHAFIDPQGGFWLDATSRFVVRYLLISDRQAP